ncbi:hypothetical protein AGMMS49975_16250 [Clostridia bacterium]|nr:hypothetical protein AGMMS49975_16250 [Clostridia bacterium]
MDLILLTPVFGAVIGYFTNWLAIKMLFRPHKEIRVCGVRLPFTPGIIPKERHRLADKVADVVATRLLSPETLAKAISADGKNARILADRLLEYFAEHTDETRLVEGKIKNALSVLIDKHIGKLAGAFVNKDKIYENLKTSLIEYSEENREFLISKLNEFLERGGVEIAQTINVAEITKSQINDMSLEKSEEIILSVTKRELSAITWFGALLGFVIGLVPLFLG